MSRPLPIVPPPGARGRRSPLWRFAVAATLGCGMTLTVSGCGAARQAVARPVGGVLRAVPGLSRFAPPPSRAHVPPAPSSGPRVPPPPPRISPSYPDRGWEPGTGDPFSPSLSSPDATTPPPAPLPAETPSPLPGGGRQPTLLGPSGYDRSPSTRPVPLPAPPAGGSAVPPPPAPEADPRAYYPVGKKRSGGPVASLWRRLSTFSFRDDPSEQTAPGQLVSHEVDDAATEQRTTATPRFGWRGTESLIRLGRPTFGGRTNPVAAQPGEIVETN